MFLQFDLDNVYLNYVCRGGEWFGHEGSEVVPRP